MAKILEQIPTLPTTVTMLPTTVTVSHTEDDEDEVLQELFEEYLDETLWDADLDLKVNQDEGDFYEAHYELGRIEVLREIAIEVFGLDSEYIDQLSPNYVAFLKKE